MKIPSRIIHLVAVLGAGISIPLGAQEPNRQNEPPRGEAGRPDREHRPEGMQRPERPFPPQNQRILPEGGAEERGFDGERPEQNRRIMGRQPLAGPAMKMQPFVGIITRTPSPELAAQLRQPEGFGLVVEDVMPDSPAANSGLEANDFILMLDDQWLVNPGQLEALIRRVGKERDVSLTFLRAGEQKKVTVKVGERMLPVRRLLQAMPPEGNFNPEGGFRPQRDEEGRPMERDTRFAFDRARVVRRDDTGRYEISREGERRMFSAFDREGVQKWRGPVDTEEERQHMPEEVRRKFEQIERERPVERMDERPQQGVRPPRAPRGPEEGFVPGGGEGARRPRGPQGGDGGEESRPPRADVPRGPEGGKPAEKE